MTVQVFGEMTADAQRIILMAESDAWEPSTQLSELGAAAALQQLTTPLYKDTDPPGAQYLPLTWPAVVQLSATYGTAWRPGPALAEWIAREIEWRTSAPPELTVTPPPGLVPRSYQIEGAGQIGVSGRVLLFDEQRTGKTITSILGALEREARGHQVLPLIVVCPAAVVTPWVRHFRAWAPRWRVAEWRGQGRMRKLGTADVYVTSFDTARRDAASTDPRSKQGKLMAVGARGLIVDECLPAGTLIDTPNGPRAIESLQVGDSVLGVDHTTGEPCWTPVEHTFVNETTEPLVRVHGVEMTPNHPVWTAALGYIPAGEVRPYDTVAPIGVKYQHEEDHHVRVVWEAVGQGHQAQQADQGPLLRPELFGEMADVAAGVRGEARHPEAACSCPGEHGQAARADGCAGEAGGASERADESVQRPGGAGEGSHSGTGDGLPRADRGQRPGSVSSAGVAVSAPGLADGARYLDRDGYGVPVVLQGGYRLPRAEARDRGGRQQPRQPEGSSTGREEGQRADGAGLDGAAVHQPSGAEGNGRGGRGSTGSRAVYNIETGTGNYVAGGLLVHNCHRIKDPAASQTKAVGRLAAKADGLFLALSGTPITHHPANLHPTLQGLEPGAWPSGERWKGRYCLTIPGEYSAKVLGLNQHTEPEFRLTILGRHRRVARADVLNELPKTYLRHEVELPDVWRAAYDSIEEDMLAELPDGTELSAMTVLSQLNLLSLMASSAADMEITYEEKEDPETGLTELKPHRHAILKLPSWKVTGLLEIMEERPDYAIAAFAPSKQLMQLAGQQAAAKGYKVGYVVGGQSPRERTAHIDAFQARELDLLCCTTGAGGTGLTLSKADSLVFLQRPWSLVESSQAEDRAEGDETKTRGTEVIDIIARNTIETRIRAALKEKAGSLSELLQDPRIVRGLLGGDNVQKIGKKAAA